MTIEPNFSRALGTMIAYGFPDRDLNHDLDLAQRLGASVVEIFPNWRSYPDPRTLRAQLDGTGFKVHSAHGCWAGQSIRAERVDLGQTDHLVHVASVDDLKRCVDWLNDAGGRCLVVHPGGLSDAEQFKPRRAALAMGLDVLADHARGTGVLVCVENMPTGVHPGSRMADLADLLAELGRPELALALDTGHANITSDSAAETVSAGSLLKTTHVHDNNGRQDSHHPPGHGTIDWDAWGVALDGIGYDGPIMLECIRHFRAHPETLDDALQHIVGRLTGRTRRS